MRDTERYPNPGERLYIEQLAHELTLCIC
ncbi:MAG: hypothetical protein ACJASY_003978 [Halioglobus sp.]